MTDPLHASKKKIERAKQKAINLRDGILRFSKLKTHTIRQKVQGQSLYMIARREESLPDDLVWELVEGVGHLRGALDKAAVSLVAHNSRGVSGVGFPFGGLNNGKPDTFPTKRMEDGVKKKFTSDQWAFIEAQKPYPGGDDTLWAVNEIANADKHRKDLVDLSIKAVGAPQSLTVGASTGSIYVERLAINPKDCDFILDDKERETVVLVLTSDPLDYKIYPGISCSVVFGDLFPVQGKNVLTTFDAQITLVERIVGEFGQFFR